MEVVKERPKEEVSEDDLCQEYGITRSEFRECKEKVFEAGKKALVESRKKTRNRRRSTGSKRRWASSRSSMMS